MDNNKLHNISPQELKKISDSLQSGEITMIPNTLDKELEDQLNQLKRWMSELEEYETIDIKLVSIAPRKIRIVKSYKQSMTIEI